MTCTVVIVAKNAMPHIQKALDCTGKFADEIILIDNHSTDATYIAMDAISSYMPQATLYKLAGSLAELRNYGLKLATKQFVIFLDADDFLFPEVILSHLRQIEQREADVLFSPFIKLNYNFSPPDAVLMSLSNDPLTMQGGTTRCMTSFVIWRKEIIREVRWTNLLHSDQQFVLDVLTDNVIKGRKLVATLATCPSGYYRSKWSKNQISSATSIEHIAADRRIMEHYMKDIGGRDAFSYR